MAVRALFRGPSHIVTAAEPDFLRLAGLDPIGQPAAEVWIDVDSRRVQLVMDAVYTDGQPRRVDGIPSTGGVMGWVLVVGIHLNGRRYGVACQWWPEPSPTPKAPSPAPARASAPRGRPART
jgi:hypothetical protein